MQRVTAGETPPAGETPRAAEDDVPLGTPDELITTKVDVSSAWDPKWASISAHESQMANFEFLKLEPDLLKVALGTEYFVRRFDRTGVPVPETDLFAGIA
jgi:LmbE family N-acetylglucosaminyl deacetylase